MNKALYNWLEREWLENNHVKYHIHFKSWVDNLTESQIFGFDKMKNSYNRI